MAVPNDEYLAEVASGRLEPHAGLALAEVLAQIPKGDIDTLMSVMEVVVKDMNVILGTDDHTALLQIVTEKIEIHTHRQKYFRRLFAMCTANGKSTDSEEDHDGGDLPNKINGNKPLTVFPTIMTTLGNRKEANPYDKYLP